MEIGFGYLRNYIPFTFVLLKLEFIQCFPLLHNILNAFLYFVLLVDVLCHFNTIISSELPKSQNQSQTSQTMCYFVALETWLSKLKLTCVVVHIISSVLNKF